ncbi:glutamate receptor ionotropic, delta-1 [Trichonephila clavipes]|nr:glutamate receptor ionotropic, delta-1 [Trichonephila clavipes]
MACPSLVRVATLRAEDKIVRRNGDGSTTFLGFEGRYLEAILQGLNAQFQVITAEDRSWGQLLPDGNWTGMIGKIHKGQADIAVYMMTMTESRLAVVNYSPAYTTEDVSFAIEKLGALPKSSAFLRTFDDYIWIATLTALFIFTIMYKILIRYKCSYSQILFMLIVALLKQPVDKDSDSLRYRLLISTWMIFSTVLSFSYSAVFLSLLTFPGEMAGVQNFQELSEAVMKNNYVCFTPRGSATIDLLLRSEKEYLRNLGQTIVRNEWYINDVPPPLNSQMNKSAAMIGGKTWLAVAAGHETWKHYSIAEDSLLSVPLAVAMNKNFCLRKKLNWVISSLNNAGLYEKISKDESFKLWNTVPERRRIIAVNGTALSLSDLMSAFLALLIGLGLAIISFVCEIMHAQFKRKVKN